MSCKCTHDVSLGLECKSNARKKYLLAKLFSYSRALKFGSLRKPLNRYQHTVVEKAFPCFAHAPSLLLFTTEVVVVKKQQQQPPLTRPGPVVAHCVHYYPGFPQQLLG